MMEQEFEMQQNIAHTASMLQVRPAHLLTALLLRQPPLTHSCCLVTPTACGHVEKQMGHGYLPSQLPL